MLLKQAELLFGTGALLSKPQFLHIIMSRFKEKYKDTDEYKEKILEILSQTKQMLQSKKVVQDISSLIDSINYSTDKLTEEVNNYYSNRELLEKLLVKYHIKDIPPKIDIFQYELRRRSFLS